MKILEVTVFSHGACGVWNRVKNESIELAKKGYKVLIFSTNIEKDTNKIVPMYDKIEGTEISIRRFPAKKLGGESFMWWFKEEAFKEAMKFNPDIILVHGYRHLHTTKCLKLKKILEKQNGI